VSRSALLHVKLECSVQYNITMSMREYLDAATGWAGAQRQAKPTACGCALRGM
jgi:hypothetical protein